MSVSRLVQYRFRFKYTSTTSGNVDQLITPKYDKSLLLETEKESDEFFYRTKTSFKFILTREDYQLIKDAPFDEDYEIILESNFSNQGWLVKWEGLFNYTDCEFDEDKRNVRFSADTNDVFKPILDNWEREFNLFDLDIPSEDVGYLQKGLIQFYVLGQNVVTNTTTNGPYYEQPMKEPTEDVGKLFNINHFSSLPLPGSGLGADKYWVSGSGNITPDVTGYYTFNGLTFKYENGTYEQDFVDSSRVFLVNVTSLDDFDDYNSVWQVGGVNFVFTGRSDISGQTSLYFFRQGVSNGAPSSGTLTHVSGAVNTDPIIYQSTSATNENDGIRRSIRLLAEGDHKFIGPTFGDGFAFDNPNGVIFESVDNSDKCSLHITAVVCRILTNEETIPGQTVLVLPEDDVVSTNYKFAIRPSVFRDFFYYDLHSTSVDFFGKFASNAPNFASEHFVRPTDIVNLIPLAQSNWKYGSLWFKVTSELSALSILAQSRRVTQSFKLNDVIKSVLGEFSDATFEPDVAHSSFLYSDTNPISLDARNDIYITPKSNVTKNGYDVAASRAIIKFKDLMDSIKTIMHSGWHVDDQNRFRIEHQLWYWYGGQNTAPLLSTDLTSLLLPRNQKPWSFGTSKYNYEKRSIPSQSTFKWMDVSGDVFEGFPIEFTDKYVDKSLIDQNIVTIFSTDIDSMVSNPDNFSKDGFVIFDVDEFKDIFHEWIIFKGITIRVQNGRFSFPYLHDKFYKKPSKAGRTNINGSDLFTTFIDRTKIQNLEFPLSLPTFDLINLIKSKLGDGKIGSMTENIITHELKMKLRHDTKK